MLLQTIITSNPLTLLVLDLALHVVDGVRGLHLQGDGLAGQGLHEDLRVRQLCCTGLGAECVLSM